MGTPDAEGAPLPDSRVLQLHSDLSRALRASAMPHLLRMVFRSDALRADATGGGANDMLSTPFPSWYLIGRALNEGIIDWAGVPFWSTRLSPTLAEMAGFL